MNSSKTIRECWKIVMLCGQGAPVKHLRLASKRARDGFMRLRCGFVFSFENLLVREICWDA